MRHVTTLHSIPVRVYKGAEQFLLVPQRNWKIDGGPMLAPLTKKLLPGDDPLARTLAALELEGFDGDAPVAFRRTVLPSVGLTLRSPSRGQMTDYEIIPVLSHYHRGPHERRAERAGGRWMTRTEALRLTTLSPTGRAILERVRRHPAGPLAPQALAGTWTERLVHARDLDRRAYGPLFVEMRAWLEGRLWAWFPRPLEVEEVLAETCASGLAHLDAFDGRSAEAWLGTIARNHEIAVLRRRGRRRTVSLDAGDAPPPVADDSPGPRDSLEEAEEMAHARARLERVKKAMSPVCRLAWRLRYEERMQFNEIGDALSVPSATVVTWLDRAKKKLLRADGPEC